MINNKATSWKRETDPWTHFYQSYIVYFEHNILFGAAFSPTMRGAREENPVLSWIEENAQGASYLGSDFIAFNIQSDAMACYLKFL